MNIEIQKLKQGNKVLLETKESIFDIEILDPANGLILIEGSRRFAKDKKEAVLVGAYGKRDFLHQDSLVAPFQIEQGLGIEIKYRDKDDISCDFVTSPVLSAKIHGTDAEGKSWGFEMWDTSERDKNLADSLHAARVRLHKQETVTPPEEDQSTDENPL